MVTVAVEPCMKHTSEMTIIQNYADGLSILVEYNYTPHSTTVEPLYYGHQGDRNKCRHYRGVRFREVGFIWINRPLMDQVKCP